MCWDGFLWDILYFDYYHDKKIQKAPPGFFFAEKVEGLTGINQYILTFPENIYAITQQCAQKILGIPLANPFMRHVVTRGIRRPPEFVDIVEPLLEFLKNRGSAASVFS